MIGSELFVREIAAKLFGSARAERKRLAKGAPPDASDSPLFAYRQLNPALRWKDANHAVEKPTQCDREPVPWIPSLGFCTVEGASVPVKEEGEDPTQDPHLCKALTKVAGSRAKP